MTLVLWIPPDFQWHVVARRLDVVLVISWVLKFMIIHLGTVVCAVFAYLSIWVRVYLWFCGTEHNTFMDCMHAYIAYLHELGSEGATLPPKVAGLTPNWKFCKKAKTKVEKKNEIKKNLLNPLLIIHSFFLQISKS